MSDYLFLANVGSGIVNSIQLTNFSPNRESKSRSKIEYKVGVYTQTSEDTSWKKLDEVSFKGEDNIFLSSEKYDLDIGQLAVVIPCRVDFHLLDGYTELPEPISRKVDSSPINERAAISFSKGELFSSYQGDFPYQMSRMENGTFLSFDSLAHRSSKDTKIKLIFVNIFSRKLNVKKRFSLVVANSLTKKKITSVEYTHNSAGIIDIEIPDNLEVCFYSKDALGIPLFVTWSSRHISVEHTHPPSEYFWNNKFKGQKMIKKKWLSQLS